MTDFPTARQIHALHTPEEIESAIAITYDTSGCDASRDMLRNRQPCGFCHQGGEECCAITALRELQNS